MSNLFVKWRTVADPGTLLYVSLGLTVLAILPACLLLLFPSRRHGMKSWREKCRGDSFLLALTISSLGFFLFSFQVHEKSILLPLLPATLLMATSRDGWTVTAGAVFNNMGMFTIYPLLLKDGLVLQVYPTSSP